MCGRFVIASSPELLADRFAVDEVQFDEHEPDYNVTPRAMVPIVRERPARDDRPAQRVLSIVRWGLVPSWAEDPSIGDRLINARGETVATTNSYKTAFRRRRCIVPADAFYEWTSKKRAEGTPAAKGPRQPFLVHRRDGEPMAFAGMWEIWRDERIPDRDEPDAWLRTCTIVTTRANRVLDPIHERMPVMLPRASWDAWLDPTNQDVDSLASLLVPAPADELEIYAVSTRVNKPEHNDASLIEPVELPAEASGREAGTPPSSEPGPSDP
jgi:putative SOS response-associated peptidase YedK